MYNIIYVYIGYKLSLNLIDHITIILGYLLIRIYYAYVCAYVRMLHDRYSRITAVLCNILDMRSKYIVLRMRVRLYCRSIVYPFSL